MTDAPAMDTRYYFPHGTSLPDYMEQRVSSLREPRRESLLSIYAEFHKDFANTIKMSEFGEMVSVISAEVDTQIRFATPPER